jgi:hypothetical protein
MKRLLVIAALFCIVVPMALAVPPADQGKPASPGASATAPGQSADKNAAKKCKALRKNNPSGFKGQYGDKPNAFGKCVSSLAKKHGSSS